MENAPHDSGEDEIYLSVIVPVFNESKRIHNLRKIVEFCEDKSYACEIIVVNDGSLDDTAEKASEILQEVKNSKVLSSDRNYGKGHAVATGMRHARGKYHLFTDVDLSTPLEHVQEALDMAKNNNVVTGTRKNGSAKLLKRQPILRESMGKGFTYISQLILNTWISDFTCGFKLFTREASSKIFSVCRIHRWAFDSEILFLAKQMGFSIAELPVSWKNDEDTRVDLKKVILPTLFDIFRIRFGKYSFVEESKKLKENESGKIPKVAFYNARVSVGSFLIILIVFLFLVRLISFLGTQDVGVEHDSAWYLGVAKNFATHGKYASYTNTSIDSKVVSPSIHKRVNVQDENGMVYFPAGVTVGPLYVIPQALFVKVFGFGFWQYRMWPILGYVLLLVTLFSLAYWLGGKISLLTIAFILWMRPDVLMNYAFEGYSEHIALLFILLSSLLVYRSTFLEDKRNKLLFAGSIFGAAVLTKYLAFLFLPAMLFQLIPAKWLDIKSWGTTIRNSISYLMGVFFMLSIYGLYVYSYTTVRFGKAGFRAVVDDFVLTWKSGGGGFGQASYEFIIHKVQILSNLGHANIILFLAVIILVPWFILKFWRDQTVIKFMLSLYIAFVTNYLWFSMISQTGWLRHIWMAIILLVLLLVVLFSKVADAKLYRSPWMLYLVVIFVLLLSFVVNENSNPSPIIGRDYVSKLWARGVLRMTANRSQAFVFSPLFSWKDLKGVTSFLDQPKYRQERLYQAGSFLVTEVAMELSRPIYTLSRIIRDQKDGLLVVGPYQKGESSLVPDDYLSELEASYCTEVIYENPSYMICTVKMTKFDIGKK